MKNFIVPFPAHENMQHSAVCICSERGASNFTRHQTWIQLLRKEVQKLVSRNVQFRSIHFLHTHTHKAYHALTCLVSLSVDR